jgi:hypothetical protein
MILTTEAQRHGENTSKKAGAKVHVAASSLAFESTEVAEDTEKLDWRPRGSASFPLQC